MPRTKRWGTVGYRAAYPGNNNLGEWKTFDIPVGQYYTGEFDFLTLVNNHNVKVPTAESTFSIQRCRKTIETPAEPGTCPVQATCKGRRCIIRVRAADPTGARGLGPVNLTDVQLTAIGSQNPLEVPITLRSRTDRNSVYAFTAPVNISKGILTMVMDGGQCSGGSAPLNIAKKSTMRGRSNWAGKLNTKWRRFSLELK